MCRCVGVQSVCVCQGKEFVCGWGRWVWVGVGECGWVWVGVGGWVGVGECGWESMGVDGWVRVCKYIMRVVQ